MICFCLYFHIALPVLAHSYTKTHCLLNMINSCKQSSGSTFGIVFIVLFSCEMSVYVVKLCSLCGVCFSVDLHEVSYFLLHTGFSVCKLLFYKLHFPNFPKLSQTSCWELMCIPAWSVHKITAFDFCCLLLIDYLVFFLSFSRTAYQRGTRCPSYWLPCW